MAQRKQNWWERKEVEPGEVQAAKQELKGGPSSKETLYALNSKLYGCTNTRFLSGASSRVPPHQAGLMLNNGRLQYNLIRAIIDALVARVGSKKPRIRFHTMGAAYKSRRNAQNYTQWCDGLFYQNKTHELGKQVFRDSCVFGTGVIKVFPANDTVYHNRVPVTEVFVDDDNAGHINAWYEEKLDVSPDRLIDMYPDHEESLKDITKDVDVTEAWYTPVNDEGRWVVAIDNKILLDEPWTYSEPPFAAFRWKEPLFGFLGESVVSELLEIQAEINFLLMKSQEQMNMQSWHVFLASDSGIKSGKITNAPVTCHYKNAGTENPFVLPIPGVSPEILERIGQLKQEAFNLVGIAEMWAQSEKPAGLNSAPALQQYESIQSARFQHVEQAFHNFYVDVARRSIELANHMAKEGTPVKVHADYGDGLTEVEWKHINLEKESFQLRASPTSILPITPAGQLEFIMNLSQSDPSMANQLTDLVDYPDIQAVLKRKLAPKRLIDKMLDDMMIDKKLAPVDDNMDLQYAMEQSRLAYNQTLVDGGDDDVIEMLSAFMSQVEALLNPPAPEQPTPEELPPEAAGQLPPEGLPPGGQMPIPGPEGLPPPAPQEQMGPPTLPPNPML